MGWLAALNAVDPVSCARTSAPIWSVNRQQLGAIKDQGDSETVLMRVSQEPGRGLWGKLQKALCRHALEVGRSWLGDCMFGTWEKSEGRESSKRALLTDFPRPEA